MRQSVKDAFWSFSVPLEGYVDFLYADVKGLITIGVGNLVDPLPFALPLPFVDKVTGAPASRDAIAADWARVKGDKSLAKLGHRAAAHVTKLRLPEDAIRKLVADKLDQMWRHLVMRYKDAPTWPADAQLGLLSMAWAMGPGFNFPMFATAVRARNFKMAALECSMSENGNPGVAPRNRHNRVLFRNAAMVEEDKMDPERLYWPTDLTGGAVTQPEGV